METDIRANNGFRKQTKKLQIKEYCFRQTKLLIPPTRIKDSLTEKVSNTRRKCIHWQEYLTKSHRKWFPIIGDYFVIIGHFIKNGCTLISIAVSTSTKRALNKRTLERSLFPLDEMKHLIKISFHSLEKTASSCFLRDVFELDLTL